MTGSTNTTGQQAAELAALFLVEQRRMNRVAGEHHEPIPRSILSEPAGVARWLANEWEDPITVAEGAINFLVDHDDHRADDRQHTIALITSAAELLRDGLSPPVDRRRLPR